MKIRNGFVSNSSSSSFIIITSDTEEFEAIFAKDKNEDGMTEISEDNVDTIIKYVKGWEHLDEKASSMIIKALKKIKPNEKAYYCGVSCHSEEINDYIYSKHNGKLKIIYSEG